MRAGFSEGGRAAAMVDGDGDAAAGEAGELFPELRKLRGAQSRDHRHLEARTAAGAQRILHDVLGDVGGEASDSPYLAA